MRLINAFCMPPSIGVGVDSINHLGQTPLFCASLLGFVSVAEKLLQYGANPNQ